MTLGPQPSLGLAGRYRRNVAGSLSRVWENVFDWQHLPCLHSETFQSVALLARGRWGWRISVTTQPAGAPAQVLEMRADRSRGTYVVTTLEGAGRGTEVRTELTRRTAACTAVAVEFHVPESRPDRLARIADRYGRLYEQLWDQDEAMIRARESATRSARRARPADAATLLGPVEGLRDRLPLVAEFGGERFRVVEVGGEILVHAATCPHWLGPLDAAPVIAGCVRCPWHGYSFDVRTGRSADGHGLVLPPPPRLELRGPAAFLVR